MLAPKKWNFKRMKIVLRHNAGKDLWFWMDLVIPTNKSLDPSIIKIRCGALPSVALLNPNRPLPPPWPNNRRCSTMRPKGKWKYQVADFQDFFASEKKHVFVFANEKNISAVNKSLFRCLVNLFVDSTLIRVTRDSGIPWGLPSDAQK